MIKQYRPKPLNAITFDDFIKFGLGSTTNIVDGKPWSFEFNGQPVTHQDNDTFQVGYITFRSHEVLIWDDTGLMYTQDKITFLNTFEAIEPVKDHIPVT
jgi:hypothetical protein